MGCLTPKGILACVGVLFLSHPCHQHVCAFTAYDQEQIKPQNGAQIYQNYWMFWTAPSQHLRTQRLPPSSSSQQDPISPSPAPEPLMSRPGEAAEPPGGAVCAPRPPEPAPAAALIRPCGAGRAAPGHSLSAVQGRSCSSGSHNHSIWDCKLNWLCLEGVGYIATPQNVRLQTTLSLHFTQGQN